MVTFEFLEKKKKRIGLQRLVTGDVKLMDMALAFAHSCKEDLDLGASSLRWSALKP